MQITSDCLESLGKLCEDQSPPEGPTEHSRWPVRGTDWTREAWLLLMVVCGAQFLDGLDVSMAGVAIPRIGQDLHLSANSLQWILSAYVLGYGGFLLLGGRVSDLAGRRRVFLLAVLVFGAASLISGLMTNGPALIVLRFLKGTSAGFTVPAGLSILTTSFTQGPARSRALSILAAFGASGFTLGLVAGGFLTEVSWQLTLSAPGVVAIAIALVGAKVIPRSRGQGLTARTLDLAGAVTIITALLVFVETIVEAPRRGWASGWTIGGLALSAALATLFVVIELHVRSPLVRLSILRSASLLRANLAGAVLLGTWVGFQFMLTLYVQDALGWSPVKMAVSVLPASLIAGTLAPRMGPVMERVGTARVLFVGMAVQLVGWGLLLQLTPSSSYVEGLLPTMVLSGAAFAIAFPAVNGQATAGIPDHEQGLASGVVNTSIQLGGAIVLAVVTAVLGASPRAEHDQLLPNMKLGFAVLIIADILAVGVTAAGIFRRRGSPSRTPKSGLGADPIKPP
jgi:MFS family permease